MEKESPDLKGKSGYQGTVLKPVISVPEHLSRRIQAIRYIGILGVVFCHVVQAPYFFLQGEDFMSYYDGFISDSLIGLTHSLVLYGLFYGAVPMFFMFSGYLNFIKERSYGETVSRRVQSLLMPMVLWTALNIAVLILLQKYAGIKSYSYFLLKADWHLWFNALFGNYSHAWIRGTHCPAIMYQFWFIRDLFILTLLTPVIGYFMRKKQNGLYFLIAAGMILVMGFRPIIVGGDSLFYFSLGAFFAIYKIDFLTVLDKLLSWWSAFALLIVSVAIMYVRYTGEADPDVPMWVQLSSALLLMKLSYTIANSEKLFKIASFLDGQAFFLYCSHAPTVGLLCAYAGFMLLPDTAMSITVVVTILALGVVQTVICTSAGIFLQRFCPRIFSLLTGGRVQRV